MRIGFRSPDDLTGLLIDRENDGAISRSATQSTRRRPWGEPAKAVNQPHIASDNDQGSFDIRCVAGALSYKTRDREIVHIILSPDQLPGEAVQFGQVAGHVIEVEIGTIDGRSGRDAALGITCCSRVGYCLVDPLDPELTHSLVVDRPPLETPGILQINSFRERRNLYRQQQQGETLAATHGGETEHKCLRGHVEKCCKGSSHRFAAKYVPWVRGCVSANACMNLHPAIGKSILLPCLYARPECAVQRGERVRSADQKQAGNVPTKVRCPQAQSEPPTLTSCIRGGVGGRSRIVKIPLHALASSCSRGARRSLELSQHTGRP